MIPAALWGVRRDSGVTYFRARTIDDQALAVNLLLSLAEAAIVLGHRFLITLGNRQ